MKRIVVSCICLLILSACSFDILMSPKESSYVKNKNGYALNDCKGGGVFKNDSTKKLENFWKDNNLPYGTLDYRCKDGKPYMPENSPQPNKKK